MQEQWWEVCCTLVKRDRNWALEKRYMGFKVCKSDMTKKIEAPLAASGRYTSRCSDSVVCKAQRKEGRSGECSQRFSNSSVNSVQAKHIMSRRVVSKPAVP